MGHHRIYKIGPPRNTCKLTDGHLLNPEESSWFRVTYRKGYAPNRSADDSRQAELPQWLRAASSNRYTENRYERSQYPNH